MILKPYADADYYSVSQYFPKKEIDKYMNRGRYGILSLFGIYKSHFYLLQDISDVIGCGIIRRKWSRDTKRFGWWLYAIWINPDFRGQGLGMVLMEELFNELREKHVKRVYLTVRNNNSIAINLYNKLGFVTIKEHSTYKVMQYEL
jgi:ribosomal protein S18 acetylase RimI-like enzyme